MVGEVPQKRDSKQIGEDEYCYSLLAKECGIEMPETRLFEDKYFGVERFDRILNGKLHVVSVAGLIGADYRLPSIDYLHIFKVVCSIDPQCSGNLESVSSYGVQLSD